MNRPTGKGLAKRTAATLTGLAASLLALGLCLSTPRVAQAAPHPDFTGLWKIADGSLAVKPEDDVKALTDEGQRRRRIFQSDFDPLHDDPNSFCVAHGMPWIMLSRARDYLIDIYQTPQRVTLLFEGMDWHRLIRLDQKQVPEGYTPGSNGYSLGHWEGDTLVIATDHLRATPEVGLYQRSEQMQLSERWRLIRHLKYGRALEVTIDVVDPVIFRGHSRGHQLFVPADPGSVLNEYGCTESLFEDHLAGKAKQRNQGSTGK